LNGDSDRSGAEVRRAVLCWLLWAAGIWGIALLAGRHLPPERSRPHPRSPVEALSTWDSVHYAHIAANGYTPTGVDRLRLAFFPLYPALSRLVGGKSHAPLAGILIAQLCALAAALLLQREERRARGGGPLDLLSDPAFWLVASPCSFFLGVFYAESLFVLLTLATAVAWRRGRGPLAVAGGLLAGLARPTAITLPAITVPALLSHRKAGGFPFAALAVAAAPLAGVGIFLVYAGVALKDPFGYPFIMKLWGHEMTVPFLPVVRDVSELLGSAVSGGGASRQPPEEVLLRLLSTLGVAGLAAAAWRRLDAADRAYFFLSFLLILSREPSTAAPRHQVALYPVFLLLARADLGRLRLPLAIAFVLCQGLLLVRHVSWLWVA